MSDRLTEIRARLDAATPGPWDTQGPCMSGDGTYGVFADDGAGEPTLALRMSPPDADLVAHAPDDLAWLLAALESERRHSATLSKRVDRHLLENVRLLAEVERLHGGTVSERSQDTSLSVGKPLRTENGTELLPAWKAAAKKWRKRALMYERVKS